MSDRTGMSVSAARQYTGHVPEKKDAHSGYIKLLDFDELKALVLPKIDFATWPGFAMPPIIYTPGQFDSALTAPPKAKRILKRKPKANKH